jgi:hypothetical protein
MRNAIRAGVLYFGLVFGAGFVLGALRVTVTAPQLGELPAVLLELPVMLAISWWACGMLVRRCRVPHRVPDRLAMGLVAFALVMAAEFAVSVWVFGRPPATYLAQYRSGTALLGLAAQLVFAALPLLRR